MFKNRRWAWQSPQGKFPTPIQSHTVWTLILAFAFCWPEQTSLLSPFRSLSWKGNLYHLRVTFRGSACGAHEDAQHQAWGAAPHSISPPRHQLYFHWHQVLRKHKLLESDQMHPSLNCKRLTVFQLTGSLQVTCASGLWWEPGSQTQYWMFHSGINKRFKKFWLSLL